MYNYKHYSNINKSRFSKNLKIESRLTLPFTISSSNRKPNFPNIKKNSWLKQKNISYIYNENNSDTKTEKESLKQSIVLSTEPNKRDININLLFSKKNINKRIP